MRSIRENEQLSRNNRRLISLFVGTPNSVYAAAFLMSQFGGCSRRHELSHIDLLSCMTASDQHIRSRVTSRCWLSSLFSFYRNGVIDSTLRGSVSRTSATLYKVAFLRFDCFLKIILLIFVY